MILMLVLCLRCHTDQVMKGDKTKVHIWVVFQAWI
jgi:hypothetical protein